MSLFNKIEIKPEMEPFIKKGEGVGIVKVDGYGKASARIESHKIILESYKEDYPIIESISAISILSYDPGNFFQEPKLGIGFGQKEYTLAGVDNNDEELEAFYNTILKLKKLEKNQNINSIKQNSSEIQKEKSNEIDELNEVENELDNKNSNIATTSKIKNFLSKKHVNSEQQVKENDSQKENSKDIKDFLTIKSKESDDLEAVLEDEKYENNETIVDTSKETENVEEEINTKKEVVKDNSEETETTKEKSEIELIEESDEFDEFDEFEVEEEIILEDEFDEDELIIEDEDDDEILMVEEENDDESLVVEEEEEDLINEDRTEKVSKTNENNETPKDNSNIQEELEKTIEQPVTVETTKKQILEKQEVGSTSSDTANKSNINQNNLKEEISQVKEDVNDKINNINQEISNQDNLNQTTSNTFDPVYQIRRYHELKEEGIITEEEFEQKKKQLLDL